MCSRNHTGLLVCWGLLSAIWYCKKNNGFGWPNKWNIASVVPFPFKLYDLSLFEVPHVWVSKSRSFSACARINKFNKVIIPFQLQGSQKVGFNIKVNDTNHRINSINGLMKEIVHSRNLRSTRWLF